MKPFDTVTQTQLDAIIDLIYEFYHKEITLNIDDPVNDYCNLTFNISGGEDAGTEIIFNHFDKLRIGFTGQKLAGMNYQLRLFYYHLDKGDYSQSHDYGELQSMLVDLDSGTVEIPFTDNQIYMQKDFELVIARETGYNLTLVSDPQTSALYGDNVKLTATLILNSEPVPDTPITFYDGETQIGDAVNTDANGVAEITVNNFSIATHTIHAECSEATSNNVNLIINRIPPVLTLTTQTSTVTYGDSITFTGTSALPANKEISIMRQNTEIATAIIQNDGTFSATVSNIGDAGNTIIYADYAGDAIYADGISNDLNITINKATPILTVNAPSTVNVFEDFHISGTLSINYDGRVLDIVGLTSYAYAAYVENQAFDETFTINTPGTYNVFIGSEESTNYYNVETTITIVATAYDGIVLSAQKPVLSFKDNDKTDLYAQLMIGQSSASVAGVTITFKQGNTVLGTATTDATGKATLTNGYTSAGIGDVSLTATDGMILSETYSIEDCRFFDVSSSENVSQYGSSSSFSYDSTEQAYYISTSSPKNITRDSVVGDFDFEITMDFKMPTTTCNFYCGESTSTYECQGHVLGTYAGTDRGLETYYTNSSQGITGRIVYNQQSFDTNKWYTYKVTRIGNVLTAQILEGDTVIATTTDSNVTGTNNNVSWHNYVAVGQLYWKNIKFKQL